MTVITSLEDWFDMEQGPTLSTRVVPLPGNRSLFVGLSRSGAGEAEDIVLAVGFNPATAVATLISNGITLPADALPEVNQALDSLMQERR